jgi:hypothetical protein
MITTTSVHRIRRRRVQVINFSNYSFKWLEIHSKRRDKDIERIKLELLNL